MTSSFSHASVLAVVRADRTKDDRFEVQEWVQFTARKFDDRYRLRYVFWNVVLRNRGDAGGRNSSQNQARWRRGLIIMGLNVGFLFNPSLNEDLTYPFWHMYVIRSRVPRFWFLDWRSAVRAFSIERWFSWAILIVGRFRCWAEAPIPWHSPIWTVWNISLGLSPEATVSIDTEWSITGTRSSRHALVLNRGYEWTRWELAVERWRLGLSKYCFGEVVIDR